LLPGRAPTTGGIDLVDLPPAKPDRAQSLVDEYIANAERENRRVDKVKKDIDTLREGKAMGIIDELRNEPRTLVEVQETTEPRVVQNSIESVDTAQDQMAGRVSRTVQRDIDGDLAAFDTVQDSLEQRGAFPVETERVARIARNRAKDKARVSDYMSDVLESVISEAEFTSETIPSDLLKLAERAGTGNIDAQDVNTFKNWAGTEFKNDPAVLSEINETLSSNIFSSETSTKQRGATPVEAARAAANVIEGEPVYTQTDRLVDEGRSYLRAQEIDPNFGNQYEVENRAQAAQVRDRISRAKALQDAGNEILEELKLEGAREQVASDPQAFLRKFNRANPEEVSGTRVVDNARQRRDLSAVVGDPLDQPRVTTESVLAGIDEPPDTTMRGRALRGGKIQADGSISYLDDSGQKYYSADTGTKAKLDTGEEYQPLTRVSNELDKLNSAELEALAVDVNNPAASAQQQDLGRMAQEKLRGKAARQLEGGYDLTPEQSRALERARASVDASQAVQRRYADEKRSRPVMPEGPQQDVARSMETMRRGMAVEPSELPPVIDNVQAMYGEGKGERVAAVGAPTVYTGAAREAAGPVLFTGKSKAESVVAGPRLTGQEIKTATGRAYDAVEPGLMSTTVNVAGTPRNRQTAQQVESNAQQFLSDAISGGLTPKTQQTLEVVAPIRASDTPATPATRYPITQSYTPSSVEASQRTGYARYQPGQSEQAPISPFIGEMSGGTRQQSTELAGPLRTDIGRTTPNLSASQGQINRLVESPVANVPSVGSLSTQQISGPLPASSDSGAAYGRYRPARRQAPLDLEAPIRRATGNPNAGTVKLETTYDISPRAREELAAQSRTPIGPLTQSPGLPRVGLAEETPFVQEFNTVQGQQRTERGKNIAYPRMMKVATANRPAARLMTPLTVRNQATGEVQTINLGAGPLRTYRM
jgi:hypothetical protein